MTAPPIGRRAGGELDLLAARMAADCLRVVDVDELVAAIEATGVNDRVAQQQYGFPSVFALGEAVLSHLDGDRGHQLARLAAGGAATGRPDPYIRQALLRSALYLTPVLLAAAVAGPLGRVDWPAPAAALVVGWSGAQALAYLAHLVGAHRGPGAGTRVLAVGFLGLAGAWSAVLAMAPAALVGPDRGLAYVVSLAELAYFAAVAAALVTRAEAAVLAWTMPSWLVSVLAVGGWWPAGWRVPVEVALLATLALILGRAYRHVARRATGTGHRVRAADAARALAYLVIGLGQALAFVVVWRAEPGGSGPPPAALPLLAAVPMMELFVGWHTARVAAGLDAYDDRGAYRRHLRRGAAATIAALCVPLALGLALGASAYRLPLGLSAQPGVRGAVLAVAAGVLLAGVFTVVLLLATRRWLATAALVAVAPVGLTVGALAGRGGAPTDPAPGLAEGWLLPTLVLVLSTVYALGLVIAAAALLDPRSYR
ncbi:MAG TPA: hypothetical protein VES42_22310 [Pilimelia sp.]|nr:hypothetical protein [Pilimelia sp.]